MSNSNVKGRNVVQLEDYLKLVDALCVLHFGWSTEEHREAGEAAQATVWQHTQKLRKQVEIEALEKRLQVLKGE